MTISMSIDTRPISKAIIYAALIIAIAMVGCSVIESAVYMADSEGPTAQEQVVEEEYDPPLSHAI